MTTLAPFQPSPGTGQLIATSTTADDVALNADDRQVVVTNHDLVELVYVRIAATGDATVADFAVPPTHQVCLTKGAGATRLSVVAAAGTPSVHICTGNGWLNS